MNPFTDPVARVVALTQPLVKVEDEIGRERPMSLVEFIAFCARVSNPDNQLNYQTMPKLLAYLQANKHWSPFEMTSITVEVKTSRAIAHQLLRHRSFSFQEFSQRYSDIGNVKPVVWEPRLKGATNRQGSLEVATEDSQTRIDWERTQDAVWAYCTEKYRHMIDHMKLAPEVARAILPEGLTPTTLYVAGTVRSWIHYLSVRLDPHTQKEHRDGLALPIRNAIVATIPEMETLI